MSSQLPPTMCNRQWGRIPSIRLAHGQRGRERLACDLRESCLVLTKSLIAVGMLSVIACSEPPSSAGPDANGTEQPDAPVTPSPQPSHARKLRGVWLATVWNLDFPKSSTASASAQTQELKALIDKAAAVGANAVFLQVRTEADALYQSSLEPWSRFLTGTQGKDPGYDPLAVAIEHAHSLGVEVHAWVNPYRARASNNAATAANHISKASPGLTITYGSQTWIDPGSAQAQTHIRNVVKDVATRYNVNGVHIDDYFYPYPVSGQTFNDNASFEAYRQGGGNLDRVAWRRANITKFVIDLGRDLAAAKPGVRFSASPFGIYKPGEPAGITGLDAYNELGCDPLAWLDAGATDYVIPQLYWPTTQTRQAYGTLLQWWQQEGDQRQRAVPAGITAERFESSSAWSLDEYRKQLTLAEQADGAVIFGASKLFATAPLLGLVDELWQTPALPPSSASDESKPQAPSATVSGTTVTLRGATKYVVYRVAGEGFSIAKIVGSGGSIELESGNYAITAVGSNGREGEGTAVTVP